LFFEKSRMDAGIVVAVFIQVIALFHISGNFFILFILQFLTAPFHFNCATNYCKSWGPVPPNRNVSSHYYELTMNKTHISGLNFSSDTRV